ncbi:DUF1947 domain-containing protein [Candidatus Bathyarchaeota archaeon]|nr:DUF1947 domain-containing protein [Candidatus Bathyarchaeota archaeon]NIU81739.1 DUF1947 domain-containing protein [Candidatus Bathyarchaeota archaeon]NIV68375.1 DUF1947 domain-containing protein [Candidatus Bathyarchaeota archaeon]NIW16691.1 DUF1947 domain-containing protein [Candidatus Bathyarchaeota archaeon]NIW34900.1 DUF1947 domain-containing protein [Candidatus Bathyarchaeota archaeon]
MPKTIKRHFLKERETERILQELSDHLDIRTEQLLGSDPRIELAETNSTQIFVVQETPILARIQNRLFPTLMFKEIFQFLPKIVVDMGAVPHICNGADVMAPGVVCVNGDFNRNKIVVIVDEKHHKPLAVGVALFDSQPMRKLKQGKVVENIHYVGDRLWKILKRIQ